MKLTSKEVAAAEAYSGDLYSKINDGLRFGEEMGQDARKAIGYLDSAIRKTAATDDMIVYRGVDERYARELERRNLKANDRIIDAAFVSTSTKKAVAKRFLGSEGGGLLLKIRAPAGSKLLDMGPYSTHPKEHEILLGRDVEMRVIGYNELDDALEVEVIT